MPIRRQHRWLYPIDWRELSAAIRFRRAKGRCEHCGRPHLKTVQHLGDGRWWDEARGTWRDGRGRPLRRQPPPHSTVLPIHTWQPRTWTTIRCTTEGSAMVVRSATLKANE